MLYIKYGINFLDKGISIEDCIALIQTNEDINKLIQIIMIKYINIYLEIFKSKQYRNYKA